MVLKHSMPRSGAYMRWLILCLCLLSSLLSGSEASAHAVTAQELPATQAIVTEFAYSTGDPAAYAGIEVYSPNNASVEFQNGRTDALGRFAFFPDKPGAWKIIMTDGMGHKLEHPVIVAREAASAPLGSVPQKENADMPLLFRALFGLSLLVNAVMIMALIKRRRGV